MYDFISYKKRISSAFSAAFSVEAAGTAGLIIWHIGRLQICRNCAAGLQIWQNGGAVGSGVAGLQPRFFGHQRDPAVVEHEAGDAGAAVAAGVVEDGAAVAQAQELLEEANVRAYVDDFISLTPLGLPLDEAAVGAAGHTVDLDHGKPI